MTSLSLSLSLYHAHTLHQLRYPPNWFPITHLYTRMHPLWVIKRISFQVHARACSETFHRLHIIQKRIPFSSLVLNYSPTCKYSFSSNQAMFYRVLYDGQDRRWIANLMHYLFVIFQPARHNSFILERQILIIFSITTITILVVLTLNSYYVFLKKIVETHGNSIWRFRRDCRVILRWKESQI